MSRQPRQPRTRPIRPTDLVRIDGDPTEYTVQAVSRAGHDVYVTDGADTSVGSWVDINQVELISSEAA